MRICTQDHLQCSLDTLRGCDCEEGLCHAGAEAREHGPRTGELAVCIGEQRLVLVKRNESWQIFSQCA